jgi:hypothetical protein
MIEELARNLLVRGEDDTTLEGTEMLHNRSIVDGNHEEE